MFENLLSCELQTVSYEQEHSNLSLPFRGTWGIWLEDESQRIGNLNIPGGVWQNMRQSPIYFLDIPFEERLQHITEEYSQCEKEKLWEAIERIKKRLGPMETKTSLTRLEESNIKECFRILLHYYDKHYLKGLQSRQNLDALLTNIKCETVTPHNASLVSQVQVAQ
jgi:tRNA 2-selenouridine synthase